MIGFAFLLDEFRCKVEDMLEGNMTRDRDDMNSL